MRGIDVGFIRFGVGLLSLGLSLALGCEQAEDAYIMGYMAQVEPPDAEGPGGYSCADVSITESGGVAADPSSDFWMVEKTDSSGLRVQIGSFDSLLEERFYDRQFIDSQNVDRFSVTTREGVEFEFVYWGATYCDPCLPGTREPILPAGEGRCGEAAASAD